MYQPRPPNRSGETATTLILIGLILQAIEVVILFLVGLLFLIIPVLGLVVFAIAVIGIVWLALVYGFSYRPTADGDYARARTPTLVFGILSLLTLGLISGVLYIVAYAKLGDAENEGNPPTLFMGAAPVPPGTKFCSACGRPNLVTGTFCQSCGARLA